MLPAVETNTYDCRGHVVSRSLMAWTQNIAGGLVLQTRTTTYVYDSLGRLTQEEYNFRMDRAYNAKTYGELAALTADLPAGAMPTAWPVPVYQPPVTTNSLARASLVLGVAEFFTMGLTAIPAIICGHMAKREMRQTGQRGDGLATSGLVLGYMAVIFWGILIVLSIVGAVISATGTGG